MRTTTSYLHLSAKRLDDSQLPVAPKSDEGGSTLSHLSRHSAAKADQLSTQPIPIHAFDVIIADECHRGYTAQEMSVWRETINHFDAVKIGLTATPAAHTTALFGPPVFRYTVEQAILDGFLVDYEPVAIMPDARAALQRGRNVLAAHCRQTTGGQYIDAGLDAVLPDSK